MVICSTVAFSEEIVQSPSEVVRALLDVIGEKNWVKATEYLSSSFLKFHKESVLSGEYFKVSHKKDNTVVYKSSTKVLKEWKEENGFAIVTINIGSGNFEDRSSAVGFVKLVKESGCWKVEEF